MAEEFDYLLCPICGCELIYSEGTHDLGCINNPKPFEEASKRRNAKLHENLAAYSNDSRAGVDDAKNNNPITPGDGYKSFKLCDGKKENKSGNKCDLTAGYRHSEGLCSDGDDQDYCVFGISFTESAKNGTLWSIRVVDGETDYSALMRLMRDVEKRAKANAPLAANIPNLPKKVERSKVSKLAFRYNLEIEDLYSIKYSTETIERLAMFYNLTHKEIRHIKQTDIMQD